VGEKDLKITSLYNNSNRSSGLRPQRRRPELDDAPAAQHDQREPTTGLSKADRSPARWARPARKLQDFARENH